MNQSFVLQTRDGLSTPRRTWAEQRQSRKLRRFKLLAGVLLVIGFWYSVPYQFPLHLDADPALAAQSEADAFQGSMSRQVAVPALLCLGLVSLYRLPRRNMVVNGKLLGCVVAYLGWVCSSAVWSLDPAITRKRLLVFAVDAFLAYLLARVVSLQELATLGFVATGSVACVALWCDTVLLHAFRPADPDYRFMGVMTANYQAMNLFVCLVCGLTLLQAKPAWLPRLGPLVGLFACLLFLTRARIGTLLFVGALGIYAFQFIRRVMRAQARATLLVLATMIVFPAVVYAGGSRGGGALTTIFMMGRHDTENTASLSNRAPLWSELMDSVWQRPVLGTGFDAFWSPERVQKISLDQGWVVPHAHNTYLDQVLSLGLVGGLLYLAILVGAITVAWKRYRADPGPYSFLPVVLLAWVMLLSTTESLPLAPYLPTLLAYSCVARMCMRESEARREAEPARGRVRWRKRMPLQEPVFRRAL